MMDLKVIPVAQFFIAALLMYILDQLYFGFQWFPGGSYAVIVIIVLCASILGVLAILNFKQANTTVNPMKPDTASKVVSTGVYSFSRNPMYLALVLLLFAFGIYLANGFALIIIPGFVWYITEYQIKPEEKALTELFGDEYINYMSSVRRCL